MRTFISYHFENEVLAATIAYLLKKQGTIEPFCYAHDKRCGDWPSFVTAALDRSESFVLVLGTSLGNIQKRELEWALQHREKLSERLVFVCLPGAKVPDDVMIRTVVDPIRVSADSRDPAGDAAREVARRLTGRWIPDDGVPIGYLFDYEKHIIEAYARRHVHPNGALEQRLLADGCPGDWPRVKRLHAARPVNPEIQQAIGNFRSPDSEIVADARSFVDDQADPLWRAKRQLTFPEAGPREVHRYPQRRNLGVGILVSGGIAPGINAVIDGIVKRHELYHESTVRDARNRIRGAEHYSLRIIGYREGLGHLVDGHGSPPRPLSGSEVENHVEDGGSLLPTARFDALVSSTMSEREELLQRIIHRFIGDGIEALYVIGGDGSMRAAHAIAKTAENMRQPLSVVAIPKTMDNDILWVWQSFGFLSAVEKAREALLNLHTEAKSNPRLCVLQLFGSDSGFVASHAGLSSGVCDAVLIPEVPYTMDGLIRHVEARLGQRYMSEGAPYGLIAMAETALPLDARRYISNYQASNGDFYSDLEEGCGDADPSLRVILSKGEFDAVEHFFRQGRRVHGQTPDDLRKAALNIVSGVLHKMLLQRGEYWGTFRDFTSEPRHLIRSVPPSGSEVIFAQRLGALAVDNAMAGYTDVMISNWLTEFVLVPLELVVLGRKRVPPTGIFWKSVLASTGQPENMVSPRHQATGAAAR